MFILIGLFFAPIETFPSDPGYLNTIHHQCDILVTTFDTPLQMISPCKGSILAAKACTFLLVSNLCVENQRVL